LNANFNVLRTKVSSANSAKLSAIRESNQVIRPWRSTIPQVIGRIEKQKFSIYGMHRPVARHKRQISLTQQRKFLAEDVGEERSAAFIALQLAILIIFEIEE
jgi:hypothetical protein